MDQLHSVTQAAELLGMSERFVRRMIAERRIAFHKVGRHVRITEADLIRFVHEGRVDVVELTWRGRTGVA